MALHRQHLADLLDTSIDSFELYFALSELITTIPEQDRPAALSLSKQHVFRHSTFGPSIPDFPDTAAFTPAWWDISLYLPDTGQHVLEGSIPSLCLFKDPIVAYLAKTRSSATQFAFPPEQATRTTQHPFNPWDVRFAQPQLSLRGERRLASIAKARLKSSFFVTFDCLSMRWLWHLLRTIRILASSVLQRSHSALQAGIDKLLSVPRCLMFKLAVFLDVLLRARLIVQQEVFALSALVILSLRQMIATIAQSLLTLSVLILVLIPLKQIINDVIARDLRPFRCASWRAFGQRLQDRNPFAGSILHLAGWTAYRLLSACLVTLRILYPIIAMIVKIATVELALLRTLMSTHAHLLVIHWRWRANSTLWQMRLTGHGVVESTEQHLRIGFAATKTASIEVFWIVCQWLRDLLMRPILRRALTEAYRDMNEMSKIIDGLTGTVAYHVENKKYLDGENVRNKEEIKYWQDRAHDMHLRADSANFECERLRGELLASLQKNYANSDLAAKQMWVWVRDRGSTVPILKCLGLNEVKIAHSNGAEVALPDPEVLLSSLHSRPAMGFYESCQWLGRHLWQCKMRRGGCQFGTPGEIQDVPTTLAMFLGGGGQDHRLYQGIVQLPHSAGQTLSFTYHPQPIPSDMFTQARRLNGTMTMHFTSSHPFDVQQHFDGGKVIVPLLIERSVDHQPTSDQVFPAFNQDPPANQAAQLPVQTSAIAAPANTGLSLLERMGLFAPVDTSDQPEQPQQILNGPNRPPQPEPAPILGTSWSFETTSSNESFLYGPGGKSNPAKVSDDGPVVAFTPIPIATAPRCLFADDVPGPSTPTPAGTSSVGGGLAMLAPTPANERAEDPVSKPSVTPVAAPPTSHDDTPPPVVDTPPPVVDTPPAVAQALELPKWPAAPPPVVTAVAASAAPTSAISTTAKEPPSEVFQFTFAASSTPAAETSSKLPKWPSGRAQPAAPAVAPSATPAEPSPTVFEFSFVPSLTPAPAAEAPSKGLSLAERLGIKTDQPASLPKEGETTQQAATTTTTPQADIPAGWQSGTWTAADDRDLDWYLSKANEIKEVPKDTSKAPVLDTTLVGFDDDANEKLDLEGPGFFAESSGDTTAASKWQTKSLSLPDPLPVEPTPRITCPSLDSPPRHGSMPDTPSPAPRNQGAAQRRGSAPKPSSSILFNTSNARRDSNLRQQVGTRIVQTLVERNRQESAREAEKQKQIAEEVIRMEQAFIKKIGKMKAPLVVGEGTKRTRDEYEEPREA